MPHRRLARPGRFAFLLPALAALVSLPAGAVIIRGGSSAQINARLERQSNLDGARHSFVVAILEQADPRPWSGVFLGYGGDGGTGYVLTAAHGFTDRECFSMEDASRRYAIVFGSRVDAPDVIRVPANRVIIHPGHRVFPASVELGLGLDVHFLNPGDLAILAFDARKCRAALEQRGIRPAELYDGKPASGFQEARVVGFGAFGCQDGTPIVPMGCVHAGSTLVTLAPFEGASYFLHRTTVAADAWTDYEAGSLSRDAALFQYRSFPEETWFTHARDPQPVACLSHKQQVQIAPGDSGGALLLEDKHGWKLAGIAQAKHYLPFVSVLDGKECQGVVELWHPVMGERAWIQEVMRSDRGGVLLRTEAGDAGPGGGGDPEPRLATRGCKRRAGEELAPPARKRPALDEPFSAEDGYPLPLSPIESLPLAEAADDRDEDRERLALMPAVDLAGLVPLPLEDGDPAVPASGLDGTGGDGLSLAMPEGD